MRYISDRAEQIQKEDDMENESIRLNEYIEEDVKKLRDIAFPVESGLIRRLLVRYYPCAKLHPNPDDEFCMESVGPMNVWVYSSGYRSIEHIS